MEIENYHTGFDRFLCTRIKVKDLHLLFKDFFIVLPGVPTLCLKKVNILYFYYLQRYTIIRHKRGVEFRHSIRNTSKNRRKVGNEVH